MKEKREIIKKPTIHNNFKYDIKKIQIVSYLFVSFFFLYNLRRHSFATDF